MVYPIIDYPYIAGQQAALREALCRDVDVDLSKGVNWIYTNSRASVYIWTHSTSQQKAI